MKNRNVILLTIDSLRKDVVGCYGNTKRLTPFIDSIQGKCIRFTRAQSIGPYTQAAFPGILTSSYYLEYGKPKGFSPQRMLISEPLQKAEIVTAAFHSNPYLCDFFGWNRGWDMFYDSMEEEVDPKVPYVKGNKINHKVERWLATHVERGGAKPFFLWVHYMDIHEPYVPEKEYVDRVDPNIHLSLDDMFRLFQEVLLKRDASEESKVHLLKKLYDAHVCEADDYVNALFGIVDQYNLKQDTVIIITTDHGDEFGEHGGLSHDDKMYSELIDIPLLIYEPHRDRAVMCEHLVSSIDIPPTIIHLFGLDPVETFEGHSLLPFDSYPQRGCFGEAIDQKSQKGGDIERDTYFYREEDLKAIYRAYNDSWEMYDLRNDPKELVNIVLSSTKAERLKNILKPRAKRWTGK